MQVRDEAVAKLVFAAILLGIGISIGMVSGIYEIPGEKPKPLTIKRAFVFIVGLCISCCAGTWMAILASGNGSSAAEEQISTEAQYETIVINGKEFQLVPIEE